MCIRFQRVLARVCVPSASVRAKSNGLGRVSMGRCLPVPHMHPRRPPPRGGAPDDVGGGVGGDDVGGLRQRQQGRGADAGERFEQAISLAAGDAGRRGVGTGGEGSAGGLRGAAWVVVAGFKPRRQPLSIQRAAPGARPSAGHGTRWQRRCEAVGSPRLAELRDPIGARGEAGAGAPGRVDWKHRHRCG
jgi:hypothetical protein